MKVLLIGSGGREHALFTKLIQSPKLGSLHVFPANGGIPSENILKERLDLSDLAAVRLYVEQAKYDLLVVGPEQPLVDGITDSLKGVCPVFGPSKAAARLEGSKEFSKKFMQKYKIPTAQAQSFTDLKKASAYVETLKAPLVIKADGLAAGKGVTVALDHKEARKALEQAMREAIFGAAGSKVLVEEYLEGQEISVFALCDGRRALPCLASQDHKRAYEGDQGPNTGGMGAYLPVPFVNDKLMAQIQTQILDRALAGMQSEGHPFRGLLYAGLMVKDNQAQVIEFNVRFGDPETQALLPLLNEDLLDLLYQAAGASLSPRYLNFHTGAAIVVVLAAKGYPGSYIKNILLKNLDTSEEDINLLHAGTFRQAGQLLSKGGRVLNVAALGSSLAEARKKAYSFIESHPMEGLFYRKDIGAKSF